MVLGIGEESTTAHLPKDIRDEVRGGRGVCVESREEVGSAHIGRVLRLARGNVKVAAERPGISRSTLCAKMEFYVLAVHAPEEGCTVARQEAVALPGSPRRQKSG